MSSWEKLLRSSASLLALIKASTGLPVLDPGRAVDGKREAKEERKKTLLTIHPAEVRRWNKLSEKHRLDVGEVGCRLHE